MMESEIKQTFNSHFQELIDRTIKAQIENYYETQLTFQSDLEIFKYQAQLEVNANNPDSKDSFEPMATPQRRELQS